MGCGLERPELIPLDPCVSQQANTPSHPSSKLWLQLSEAQVEAWDRFAHRITRTGRVSNEHYHPTGFNMVVALFVKLWQIDPEQAVPLTPPT